MLPERPGYGWNHQTRMIFDFVDAETRVGNSLLRRFHRSMDEVFRQFVEFSTGQGQVEDVSGPKRQP